MSEVRLLGNGLSRGLKYRRLTAWLSEERVD